MTVQTTFNQKENFPDMIKVLAVLKKITKQTLSTFDSECDLYTSKRKGILTVDYFYEKKPKKYDQSYRWSYLNDPKYKGGYDPWASDR